MADERFPQDGDTPPLNIEDGALLGQIAEEDAIRRQEMLRYGLPVALRAMLADRLVARPEEEIRRAEILRDVRARLGPRKPYPSVEQTDGQP